MPVARMANQRFVLASDVVSVFLAAWSLALEAVWFVIVGALFCASQAARGCTYLTSQGSAHRYEAVTDVTLALLAAAAALDAGTIAIGLRGSPFEVSKRAAIVPLQCASITVLAALTGFNGYATWVVTAAPMPLCHRHGVDVRIMIIVTWAFLFLSWLRLWLTYCILRLFPDFHDMASWRQRVRLLMAAGLRRSTVSDIRQQLRNQGKPSLKHMTHLLTNMVKGLDLTPTDLGAGLVLVAALQRRRRGIHISTLLRPDVRPPATTLPELRAAHGTSSMKLTGLLEGHLERLQEGHTADAAAALTSLQQSLDTAHAGDAAPASLADGGVHCTLHGGDSRSCSNDVDSRRPGAGVTASRTAADGVASPPFSSSSGNDVARLQRQLTKMASTSEPSLLHGQPATGSGSDEVACAIARQDTASCLTPSSIAAELRPDLHPAEAASIYAGEHEQVDHETLQRALAFAKYAAATYSTTLYEKWLQGRAFTAVPIKSWGVRAALMAKRGKDAHKANELHAQKVGNKQQRLNYEAIVQYAGIADADLLYLSDSNQALGAVPYMVALDPATDSVVVSIRGSDSAADWVTDFLATPEPLDDWLPEAFKQEHPDLGPCFAHSGMLAAAKAVWADIQDHAILQVLLSAEAASAASRGRSSKPVGCPTGMPIRAAAQHSQARPATGAGCDPPSHDAEDAAAKPAHASDPGLSTYAAAILARGLHRREWKLVVTGHSMGAGVAALLSLKLRYMFPDMQCWAFSPPGGMVSANLSAVMEPYCTSIVVGKDIVSRVSLHNVAALLDEMLVALARCRQPTCKLLLRVSRRKWRWRKQTIDQLLHVPEDVPQEALDHLHRYQQHRPQLNAALEQMPAMQPPGRALFLRRLKARIDPAERRARAAAAREAEERARKAKEATAREAQGLGPPAWHDGLRHTLRRGAHEVGGALPRTLRRMATMPLWRQGSEPGDGMSEDGGAAAEDLWAHQETGSVAAAAGAGTQREAHSSHGRLERRQQRPVTGCKEEDGSAASSSEGNSDSHGEPDIEKGDGKVPEAAEQEDKVTFERLWDAVWIQPREVVDEGILISPRMVSDHLPPTLIGALQAVLAGGKESGTREQRATCMQPARPHARVDRLLSLARRGSSWTVC